MSHPDPRSHCGVAWALSPLGCLRGYQCVTWPTAVQPEPWGETCRLSTFFWSHFFFFFECYAAHHARIAFLSNYLIIVELLVWQMSSARASWGKNANSCGALQPEMASTCRPVEGDTAPGGGNVSLGAHVLCSFLFLSSGCRHRPWQITTKQNTAGEEHQTRPSGSLVQACFILLYGDLQWPPETRTVRAACLWLCQFLLRC